MEGEQYHRADRQARVAIVGAGLSGICMAIQLVRAGFRDFTVFEKGEGYGGTWRENTYPGLTCDVPSRYYQFTFAKNPGWSQLFSPGSEIRDYLAGIAGEYGVDRHTRFGAEVVAAEFAGGAWRVSASDGTVEEFDFLVCATGFLHHPRLPDFPGLDSFAGPVFHSARWDHTVDVRGKRIGVVGSGSTGVQLVTGLADPAERVVLFQRSANWILPTMERKYGAATRAAHRVLPFLGSVAYSLNRRIFQLFSRGLVAPGPVRSTIGRIVARHLNTVADPALRRALTPDHEPMCKRLVVSANFYRTVQRADVDVIASRIDRIEPHGVVTADGTTHPLDILVLATGFDAHAYMRPMAVTGVGGRTLDAAWAAGPHAFESMMIPGFPNLFMVIGPHSPVANHPLTAVAESQSRRIVHWIRQWGAGTFDTVAPTEAATERFNTKLREAMPGTVWATGCQSWYIGQDGLPEVWPWTPDDHDVLMRRTPDLTDYRLGFRDEDREGK